VLGDLVRRRAIDWAMVSAGSYGHLTGPVNVVPSASGHESYRGYGDLLTAFPTDPGDHSAGTVASPPDENSEPPKTHPGVTRKGDTGPDVAQVQQQLNAAGIPTPVTGTFDDDTESAVKKFQDHHPNLTADGIVGPATDAALARVKNLRKAVSTTAKVATPAVPGAYITAHEWISAHAGNIAVVTGIVLVMAVAGYLAWTYRHDIAATVNKWRGRVVP
jgi:hypothetical protein